LARQARETLTFEIEEVRAVLEDPQHPVDVALHAGAHPRNQAIDLSRDVRRLVVKAENRAGHGLEDRVLFVREEMQRNWRLGVSTAAARQERRHGHEQNSRSSSAKQRSPADLALE